MASRQVSGGQSEGTVLGQSATDKIGFYGTTAIVQPSSTNQSAITAGATTTACNTLVIELRSALVNLGLIKGSA
ncbi:MAG: hypothetical protein JSR91_00235 [Proteobacteria bacterium]|nr:hypothetical protein [Pseudomonadota bacterium]